MIGWKSLVAAILLDLSYLVHLLPQLGDFSPLLHDRLPSSKLMPSLSFFAL